MYEFVKYEFSKNLNIPKNDLGLQYIVLAGGMVFYYNYIRREL
jgi:hypothetical protein